MKLQDQISFYKCVNSYTINANIHKYCDFKTWNNFSKTLLESKYITTPLFWHNTIPRVIRLNELFVKGQKLNIKIASIDEIIYLLANYQPKDIKTLILEFNEYMLLFDYRPFNQFLYQTQLEELEISLPTYTRTQILFNFAFMDVSHLKKLSLHNCQFSSKRKKNIIQNLASLLKQKKRNIIIQNLETANLRNLQVLHLTLNKKFSLPQLRVETLKIDFTYPMKNVNLNTIQANNYIITKSYTLEPSCFIYFLDCIFL